MNCNTHFNIRKSLGLRFEVYGKGLLFAYVLITAFILKTNVVNAQFFENKGQLSSEILFTQPIYSGNVLVTEKGLSYLFNDDALLQNLYEKSHHLNERLGKSNTAPVYGKQKNEVPSYPSGIYGWFYTKVKY